MKKSLAIVMALLMLVSFAPFVMAESNPVTGAIWTTDELGERVNQNIYDNKEDVYLNGGPQNDKGGQSLVDGFYYVQVTEPNGTLLGKSEEAVIEVVDGKFTQLYNLYALTGYETTSNLGGVYKVWISKSPNFENNLSKTDNFKVKPEVENLGSITIVKFYDANGNGEFDDEEYGIEGWIFTITDEEGNEIDVMTNEDGIFVVADLTAGTYTITEMASTCPKWIATTEIEVEVELEEGAHETVEFGNLYLDIADGRTLGFWSNKNGQALIKEKHIAALNELNLGKTFELGKLKDLNTWLLGAKANNMEYMFRVQMAAMQLNVIEGFVDGEGYIYTGSGFATVLGLDEYMKVNELIAFADAMIGNSEWSRAQLEYVKNIFDSGNNNNAIFVKKYHPITNPILVCMPLPVEIIE
jgi:hypothetical protein